MSSITKHPSITVTDQTSLSEVSKFLTDNAKDGQKLYGKTDANGATVLYLKSGTNFLDRLRPGSNFLSNHMSAAQEKRETARAGIAKLFDQSPGTGHKLNLTERQTGGVQTLLGKIGSGNASGLQNRDAASVLGAVKGLETLYATIPEQKTEKAFSPPSGSGLNGTERILTGFMSLQDHRLDTLPEYAAREILANYENASPAERASYAVAIADATAFKADLARDLTASPGHAGSFTDAGAVEAMVENIYATLAESIPCGRTSGADAVQIGAFQVEPIEIGGKEYTPVKLLAEGGFGGAFLFRNEADGKSIVVKLPLNADIDDAAIRDTAQELQTHARMADGGHENIVGFLGGIRMGNGAFGIAMELAPHGTAHDFAKSLARDVTNKVITDKEAEVIRFTMVKDMAEGLSQMHGVDGFTHYDFKTPNCLIGEDGCVKIMDFGTSFGDPMRTTGRNAEIENHRWKAPEIIYGENEFQAATNKMRNDFAEEQLGSVFQSLGLIFISNEDIRNMMSKTDRRDEMSTEEAVMDDAEVEGILNSIPLDDIKRFALTERLQRQPTDRELEATILGREFIGSIGSASLARYESHHLGQFTTDEKVDVWSLGMSAFSMFAGTEPMTQFSFGAQAERALSRFHREDGRQAILPGGQNGGILNSTGNTDGDAFINRVLVGDPKERPSAASVAADPALNAKGVGSPAARDLIKALAIKLPAADGPEGASYLQAFANKEGAVMRAREALAKELA